MPDQSYVEDLGANSDMIERRVRFLRAYADRAAELDRRMLTAARELGGFRAHAPSVEYPEWLGEAARAGALARAGQHALLISLRDGQELLQAAGLAYARLGVPFGYGLLALGRGNHGRWPTPLGSPDAAFRALSNALRPTNQGEPVQQALAEAMQYPTQQTYLLIALALSLREPSERIGQLLESGLQNSAVAIGPTANSVGDYWNFVGLVMTRSSNSINALLSGMFELAQPYAWAIAKARRNQYAWERLQAPVDIVDLDVVMLSALMAQFHGIDKELVSSWARENGRDPLESIPIAIGCEIARATDAEPV